MRPHPSGLTLRVALILLVVAIAVPALDPLAPAAWSAPDGCQPPAATAVAGFFDRAVPGRIDHDRVPGAVVSVVAGGSTVFAKGYGMADAEHGVAFDPDRSLVRIASITKLFTWTAVMQQVEAGRLDPDADVNQYLTTFKIPPTYPEPVTLRTLMNHTAGFEDRFTGTGARTAADVTPLAEYLADNMPARIRPPGVIAAYSNYGAALAGHIVSQVSGEPYDRYVQRHLLNPLGMTHSTASEPLPRPLAADLARSYDSDLDPPQVIPFTFDPLTPDGSISATAADMANFMHAYLDNGRFGDTTILSAATVSRMHQRSYAAHPRLGGYAHGFIDQTINGHRVLMHDGGWEGFRSALVLAPGCDLGLFLSTNGTGGAETLTELMPAFFDRFVPASAAVPDADPTAPVTSGLAVAAPHAGFYEPTRHNESTVEKLVVLVGPLRLAVRGNGAVRFMGQDWTPQGGGVYARADGRDHLAFLAGEDGQRYVATDFSAYQLMTTDKTLPFNLVVLLVFAVVALSGLAIPLTALRRRLSRRPATTTATWRAARSLAAAAATFGLGFLVLLTVQVSGDTSDFLYGMPPSFRALLTVPVVVLAMTGAAVISTVTGWRESGASLAARIHQLAMFAGLSALAWFLWQWNLVGW